MINKKIPSENSTLLMNYYMTQRIEISIEKGEVAHFRANET